MSRDCLSDLFVSFRIFAITAVSTESLVDNWSSRSATVNFIEMEEETGLQNRGEGWSG
jgi:hypothetical protein